MTDVVRNAYDSNAELYASLFLDDLDRDQQTRDALTEFAEVASHHVGPVLDVGCGPGHVVDHLNSLGLATSGIDISPGQVSQARAAFPLLDFSVGDLMSLAADDGSLGGIVSRYSIIHLDPSDVAAAFNEWHRAMAEGAPVFVSFFGSRTAGAHRTPFDHKVVTAYELWPASIATLLESAGFVDVRFTATPTPDGGRPFDHVTMLARQASS